jgi:linoleoyl-CoA desaturase
VYGPVRTVVWQGSAGDRRPYADHWRISSRFFSFARKAGATHQNVETDLRGLVRSQCSDDTSQIPVFLWGKGSAAVMTTDRPAVTRLSLPATENAEREPAACGYVPSRLPPVTLGSWRNTWRRGERWWTPRVTCDTFSEFFVAVPQILTDSDLAASAVKEARLSASREFPAVLRHRIDQYFAERGLSKHGNASMAVKVVGGFALCAATYFVVCVATLTVPQFVLAYLLHGLAQLFVLLNVAHDSNHHAVSSKRWVSHLLCLSFDVFGINSYIWRAIHNSSHHNNINVFAVDQDVLGRGFLRFSPSVPRRALHRFQHLYAWLLYGFSTLEYVLIKDFEYFFFGSYKPIHRAKNRVEHCVLLFAGKALYFGVMICVPVFLLGRPLWLVALAFVTMHFFIGVIAQLIFQTTHIIDTTTFPRSRSEFDNYTYHVLATTADYSTQSRLARWFIGGLNYHVVHHLCPNICHVHYPELTKIVRATAAEFGVAYREHCSVWQSVARHFYLLRELGRKTAV